MPLQHEHKWWKEGIVYQIYPASFKDSNNDGIGDIAGIISKLDYIRELGVDIIWISPHYKSPQVDMGYDISDYEDIHEPYGTVEDVEMLIQAVHDRGMRIIFDLVINHTSNLHAWFLESRSSKSNPKRDWYIWRPAKYDENGNRCRPNNWRSNFSEPAWTWDENTQEYYLHLYAAEQPDLNWENEECRHAIYDSAIRFWLEKGIDGFRVDTVNRYSKYPGLPDAEVTQPREETQIAFKYFTNGPRIHEFLREINDVLSEYDVFTVGELPNTPNESDVMQYISAQAKQLNMVFNFDTVGLGQTPGDRFRITPYGNVDFKRELTRWQRVIQDTDAWTTVFLENHDQGRSISRFASDVPEHRVMAGKMLAMILGTLTGTLFIYQGQEIGMINAPLTWPVEEYKCIRSVNYLKMISERLNHDPTALSKALKALQMVARDHARVPMQWDSTANAGFCSEAVEPWMSVVGSYMEINVADQIGRKDSLLEFWKKVLDLRKLHKDLFVYGRFQLIEQGDDLMTFTKHGGDMTSLTVANLSSEMKKWEIPSLVASTDMKLIIGNMKGPMDQLGPYEGRVYISSP
ncbi:maltase [Lipomyces starkeyi NRRL Y-11557]|uniref:Maltase n=1 Tax=Lipomyces starkeyi NRRL Y-11557 TaxID=675824 RepID=A0A1E3Q6G9_LIPST|nr:maltase [Lipomyces starkeyi NRRL Y-11557]